jgi:hypothetical protein
MLVTFTSMKVALLASLAIAFAIIVLPQPGCPETKYKIHFFLDSMKYQSANLNLYQSICA